MSEWRTKIVAFCGVAGAGKSTAASFLVTDMGYQVVRLTARLGAMAGAAGLAATHLAHPGKDQPVTFLGGSTPRQFLIELGALMRKHNPDYFPTMWVQDIDKAIEAMPPSKRLFVVDDLRTQREYEAVKSRGALVIRLIPKFPLLPGMMQEYTRDSFTEDQPFPADETIINDSTVGSLAARVKATLYLNKFY